MTPLILNNQTQNFANISIKDFPKSSIHEKIMNYSTKLQTFANSAKLDEIPCNKLCHLGQLGRVFFL